MSKAYKHQIKEKFSPHILEEWYEQFNIGLKDYPDYREELEGMVTAVNESSIDFKWLALSQMLYEMESPLHCSSVVIKKPDGTVMHGRNMDYAFHFTMPDGRVLNWPDVTFEVTFYRGGKPLFKSTQWPGTLGVHTAMRLDGWTVDQQTRLENNNWQENLKAAKQGGGLFGIFVRRVLETTSDYHTAMEKIYNGRFMAPQYFIMTGAGPKEGTILTIDRLGHHDTNTPRPVELLKTANFFVQTNYDPNKASDDPRRYVATKVLEAQEPSWATWATKEHLMELMHTPPLFGEGVNAFSNVMIPATGFYETRLPMEPPAAFSSPSMVETIVDATAEWFKKDCILRKDPSECYKSLQVMWQV